MAPKRKASFQMAWLSGPKYKNWLRKKSNTHGTCILCKKDFAVDWGGEAGVTSHTNSVLHTKLAKEQSESANSLSILHFFHRLRYQHHHHLPPCQHLLILWLILSCSRCHVCRVPDTNYYSYATSPGNRLKITIIFCLERRIFKSRNVLKCPEIF